jgi:hypothetical protein
VNEIIGNIFNRQDGLWLVSMERFCIQAPSIQAPTSREAPNANLQIGACQVGASLELGRLELFQRPMSPETTKYRLDFLWRRVIVSGIAMAMQIGMRICRERLTWFASSPMNIRLSVAVCTIE